ncbi:NADPH:quinone oxidoreductase family protein [Pseudooceanicola onchidii]|uniref:NADPH:quinone oxidoreductase family protein n=1 Tax=Pseudooceanicola onchidii TaxID=2562279 RepID=UPI0010AAAE11|nr:NADPH:quinone oxidoreductase family protein [Pseudooceanicola onchidii]
MRAFIVPTEGAAPEHSTLPDCKPISGQLLMRNRACGLNFADLLMIRGKYQDTPKAPFTLGMEAAGVVEALGPDTDGPAPGTRVAVFGGSGGLAELGCYPVDRAVVLPDAVSFETAAALQIAYGTSHVALEHKARMQPGETLVVLGAAGGVGLTAVELGHLMGATVIAVARGAEKLEVARTAGADHLIDAEDPELREKIKALGGADVVYDAVGGEPFRAAFRAMKPEGRILAIGHASGDVPQIPANHLLVKNIDVLGFYWGGYLKFRPEVVTRSLATLFAWAAEGRITPHISHTLSFDRAAEGLELLKSRASTGKVVITL